MEESKGKYYFRGVYSNSMCWTELSSIITIGTSIVIAGATWEIMKLNDSQAQIAKQKRADDLFKIRWECYQEIVKYIKNTYEEKYEHYFSQCIDLDKEKQQIRDYFIKSKNLGLDLDQELDIE